MPEPLRCYHSTIGGGPHSEAKEPQMPAPEGVKVHSYMRIARPNIGLKLIGVIWLAVGLLILVALVRETAELLLAGAPVGPGALLADVAVRGLVAYVVTGLGLLMIFGGVYARVDPIERRVRSLQFYGFFWRSTEVRFDEALQVVITARSSRPSSASFRRMDGVERYYTSYSLALELKDGRRVPLGSGLDKAHIHQRGAQIAQQVGVNLLNLGLVGQP
jgi:hypothetical protein